MTPKEKAKELVDKFYPNVQWKLGQEDCLSRAKKCALIAVDELIEFGNQQGIREPMMYWQEVKQKIKHYDTNRFTSTKTSREWNTSQFRYGRS